MCRIAWIAAAALALLPLPGLLGVEPSLQPQRGVLVLRNRQVIAGDVTPVGDYYLVSLGKTGQIRLAAREVEMVCRDLPEAYQRKREKIEVKSAAAHLDLADWCLKQSLHANARQEIEAARKLEPYHSRLREMDQRLEFGTTKAAAKQTTSPKSANPTATVGAEQLERTMKELPTGAVEHFTAIVQPILTDRCGATRCHGPGGTANFQLLEPVAGKVPSRRFTQRNLFATISISNKQSPEESVLLKMALQPHGHTQAAPFRSEKDKQYLEIAEWLQSLRALPKQSPPATVNASPTGSARPQMGEARPGAPEPQSSEPIPVPMQRDPFDPEIFNRRYHPAPATPAEQ